MELQLAQKSVLYDNGNILMIQKSADDPFNPLKWEIPGGRLELGEESEPAPRPERAEERGARPSRLPERRDDHPAVAPPARLPAIPRLLWVRHPRE